MESLGTASLERKNQSCSSVPSTLYYTTQPGNAPQKVPPQATERITSLHQPRENTHSNLIFKLKHQIIKVQISSFYPVPWSHFLGSSLSAASSHSEQQTLLRDTPLHTWNNFFHCLYKATFQTGPSGIKRVKCPQVPASPVNHLLPQVGDTQLCRTKSPRCAAVHQPGNSLQLYYNTGLSSRSGNASFYYWGLLCGFFFSTSCSYFKCYRAH